MDGKREVNDSRFDYKRNGLLSTTSSSAIDKKHPCTRPNATLASPIAPLADAVRPQQTPLVISQSPSPAPAKDTSPIRRTAPSSTTAPYPLPRHRP